MTRRIVYLAVGRIRKAEFVLDHDRNRVRFVHPKGYDARKHLDGTFGLLDGRETDVELLLLADSEVYLRPRMLHATQKFRKEVTELARNQAALYGNDNP